MKQLALVLLALAPVARAQETEDLAGLLEPLREEHGMPALGAAIVRDGEVVAIGAVGVRQHGSPEEVTVDDLWHLGSCTKSMNATLAAILVERGELAWTTTIGEVFPELADDMRPEWRDVPLEQLLTNRAGAPNEIRGLWGELQKREGTPVEQRMRLVRGVLGEPPEAPPGTKSIYSNAGFSIAGAMLERVEGVAWEELMERELFEPLGMASASFGPPGTAETVDQPRGHLRGKDAPIPIAPGPLADNPPAISPAGRVHGSLRDWAKYAAMHLAGARGEDGLVGAKTFEKLHTPPADSYAMGWISHEPDWAGGRILWHNGSNTMWYCELAIVPHENVALLVTMNIEERKGSTEVLKALFRHAVGEGDEER